MCKYNKLNCNKDLWLIVLTMNVTIITVINILMSTLDFFLYYQRSINLNNYNWFIMIIFIPFIALLYCSSLTCFFVYKKKITQQLLISQFKNKYIYIGSFIETVTALMNSVIFVELSILHIILISNVSLIIRVILNYFILKKKYAYTHYIGLFCTITGSLIILLKNVTNNSDNVNIIILAFGLNFCNIIQSIIKEKIIKQDTVYEMWGYWVSFYFYQFINGLIVFPIFINIKSINDVNVFLYKAINCQILGNNSVIDDNCNCAYLWFILYFFNGVMVDVVVLIIYKNKSNIFSELLKSVINPIIIFTGYLLVKIDILSNNNDDYDVNMEKIIGFFLSFAGLLIYNFKKEIYEKNDIETPLLPS